MIIPVHILATCRRNDLLPYTTLVFDTLRVGFPNAPVTIHLNQLTNESCAAVREKARQTNANCINVDTIHHQWIEQLVTMSTSPFWILDTDVIFWHCVENWNFHTPLAGRRIPEWFDKFSGCITRARLHTSLLYLDPVRIKSAITHYSSNIADTVFTPQANLFNPLVIPFKRRPYFYDTTSLLYHAVGGLAFASDQLDCYDHLNFGTISDLVLPRLDNAADMESRRKQVIACPTLAKGCWREQDAYYAAYPV